MSNCSKKPATVSLGGVAVGVGVSVGVGVGLGVGVGVGLGVGTGVHEPLGVSACENNAFVI